MRILLPCLAMLLAAGCATAPSAPPQYAPTLPISAEPAPASPGAIYRSGTEISLFQDQKARRPGDLITIQLVERTNASTSASTKTKKDSATEIEAPTLLGGAVTAKGRPILQNSLSGARSFEGSGDSTQSNRLEGSLTVTVAERLPNGNLVVRGEKWLRLNQGNEFVQIQGIVRPADIAPDNTVLSSRVADARIAYSGRGALAQSNVMGWLTRFFQSPVFPM